MTENAHVGKTAVKLDRMDRAMLRILQENSALSDAELAEQIHLSASGCRKRRKKLEDAGVIRGYVALVDSERIGWVEDVFVVIKLHSNDHDSLAEFDSAVKGVEEVMDCHGVAGAWDYVLRVVVHDMHDYDRVCASKLTRLPGVDRLQSLACMRRVVGRRSLPSPP